MISQETHPLIIDLGKTSRKKIKRLKRSKGSLFREVQEVVRQVTEQMAGEGSGKEPLPIVILVRKKRKRRSLCFPIF